MTKCKQCNEEFITNKKEKIFCSLYCRAKNDNIMRDYRIAKKQEIKIKTQSYYQKHKEEKKEYQKIYRYTHKYLYQERKRYNREYYKKHKKEINTRRRTYIANRMRNDLNFKLVSLLRNRFKRAVKKNYKFTSVINLIGCSIEFFKKYLEKRFTLGMSWNNWGVKGWHIDHIRPCNSFNMALSEHQQACFHYTNLQPLWATDNIKKDKKC